MPGGWARAGDGLLHYYARPVCGGRGHVPAGAARPRRGSRPVCRKAALQEGAAGPSASPPPAGRCRRCHALLATPRWVDIYARGTLARSHYIDHRGQALCRKATNLVYGRIPARFHHCALCTSRLPWYRLKA